MSLWRDTLLRLGQTRVFFSTRAEAPYSSELHNLSNQKRCLKDSLWNILISHIHRDELPSGPCNLEPVSTLGGGHTSVTQWNKCNRVQDRPVSRFTHCCYWWLYIQSTNKCDFLYTKQAAALWAVYINSITGPVWHGSISSSENLFTDSHRECYRTTLQDKASPNSDNTAGKARQVRNHNTHNIKLIIIRNKCLILKYLSYAHVISFYPQQGSYVPIWHYSGGECWGVLQTIVL